MTSIGTTVQQYLNHFKGSALEISIGEGKAFGN